MITFSPIRRTGATARRAARLAFLLTLGVVATPLFGEVVHRSTLGFDFAYYPGDEEGRGVSDGEWAPVVYRESEPDGGAGAGERSVGTTWGSVELKGYYQREWTIPALRWDDGPLAAGNNVTLRSTTGVSPISVTQEMRVVVTPVAVLQLFGAAWVGTGWNLTIFDGLGTVDTGSGEVDDASFEGLVLQGILGATFQFDLAAVVPGEWNHVVAVVSPQWTARRLTGAAADEAWSFEADDGTNYRGWEYRTTAFLGYQPPLPHLRTVGVMYEGERLVGAAVDRARAAAPADFDAGFRTDRLSLLANLVLGGDDGLGARGVQRLPDGERDGGTRQSGVARRDRHTLTVVAQVERDRLPSAATFYNEGAQRRDTIGGYWSVHRLAVQYRYALR
jgi:hypothetical protein